MVLEKTLESPLDCKRSNQSILKESKLNIHWKYWWWSWNSSTLATSRGELIHLKRPWCWEGLGTGGEGADRGWDGWMASPAQWAWVWVNSGSWWWTGRPGMLWFMGSQRVGHDWVTELNWNVVSWGNRSETILETSRMRLHSWGQHRSRKWEYISLFPRCCVMFSFYPDTIPVKRSGESPQNKGVRKSHLLVLHWLC